MDVFLQYLKRYILLSSEEEIIVTAKLKLKTYLKGQYIVQSGDVCRYQTYILSGKQI